MTGFLKGCNNGDTRQLHPLGNPLSTDWFSRFVNCILMACLDRAPQRQLICIMYILLQLIHFTQLTTLLYIKTTLHKPGTIDRQRRLF